MLRLRAARVLRDRRSGTRGADRRVLSRRPLGHSRRRSRQPDHRHSPPPGTTPHMYDLIRANKRRSVLLIIAFMAVVAVVGVDLRPGVRQRPRGHGHRPRDRRRRGVRLVLEGRQDRARREPRPARRSAGVRPAAQPRRGPVHRRRAARNRASTSSTTRRRTRSPPAATRSTPRSRSRPGCSRR